MNTNIATSTGNREKAVEAAKRALEEAQCADGAPFYYCWGFERARRHLVELGEPPAEMPRGFGVASETPYPQHLLSLTKRLAEKRAELAG